MGFSNNSPLLSSCGGATTSKTYASRRHAAKVVQTECRASSLLEQAMLRCRLPYAKVVQTECRASSLLERYAEVPPTLCKGTKIYLQSICGPPFLIYTYTIMYIYIHLHIIYNIFIPTSDAPSAAVPMPPCAGLTTQGRKY